MRFVGRRVWLVVVLLLFAVAASDVEAGGGRGGGGGGQMGGGGRGGGGHGGSHHGKTHGHHGGRIVVGVGPWWGWGWWGGWPGWYYPPAYYRYYPYYPYYPYYAPPAIVTDPPVYIQRELEIQPVPQAYWHYCESAGAYYPAVQSCPEPWLKVPPRDQ